MEGQYGRRDDHVGVVGELGVVVAVGIRVVERACVVEQCLVGSADVHCHRDGDGPAPARCEVADGPRVCVTDDIVVCGVGADECRVSRDGVSDLDQCGPSGAAVLVLEGVDDSVARICG